MDNIENFIKQNRARFNDDYPDQFLLPEIEARVSKNRRTIILRRSLAVAASVLVLVCLSILFFRDDRNLQEQNVAGKPGKQNKKDVYRERLFPYENTVQAKFVQLKKLEKTNPLLYTEFIKSIGMLTIDLEKMRTMLKTTPNKQQLLEYMQYNLQLQIDLIDEQLALNDSTDTQNRTHGLTQ